MRPNPRPRPKRPIFPPPFVSEIDWQKLMYLGAIAFGVLLVLAIPGGLIMGYVQGGWQSVLTVWGFALYVIGIAFAFLLSGAIVLGVIGALIAVADDTGIADRVRRWRNK